LMVAAALKASSLRGVSEIDESVKRDIERFQRFVDLFLCKERRY